MIRRFNLFKYRIVFVFRHRWDAAAKDKYRYDTTFMDWELGLFFKKSKTLGKHPYKNTVNSYMFGFNLLICKFWIEINKNAFIFQI